jgi:hypothetical protein
MRPLRCAALTVSIALAGSALALADDPASRKPDDVVAGAQAALGKVKSFRMAGTETEKDGSIEKIAGTFTAAGAADFSLTQGKESARLIVLGQYVYVKGNAAYWKSTSKKDGAAIARRFTGKWIKQPAKVIGSDLGGFAPKRIASCLTAHVGTLTNKGVKTVDGRQVVVIADAGDKPGSAPGELWVAVDDPTVPLREIRTGPAKKGGAKDAACDDDGADTTVKGTLAFSRFDKAPKVVAPKGALTPEQAAGGSGGGSGGGGTPV